MEIRGADECWPWTGTIRNGYGAIYDNERGEKVGAHRVVYELTCGPIPDGHEIDHGCERKDCMNPAHLEAVTHAVNSDRTTGQSATCAQGHPLDGLKRDKTPDGTPRIRRYCRTCSREATKRREASKRPPARVACRPCPSQ